MKGSSRIRRHPGLNRQWMALGLPGYERPFVVVARPGKSLVMNSLRPFRAPEKAGLAPSLGHLEVLRDGDIQASRPAEGRLGVESFWPQWNF